MPVRPELDGLVIQLVGDSTRYLVDQGRARAVPDDEVFVEWFFAPGTRLWRMAVDIDIGTPLARSEVLTQGHDSPAVYWEGALGVRHIADPQTFQRYRFNGDRVQRSPIEPTPTGPEVKWVPKYNGNRIKVPSDPPLYLIDRGMKRHITEPATYQRLFGGSFVQSIDSVAAIPTGPDIGPSVRLIKGNARPEVYLLDLLGDKFPVKRHILDPLTMDYYGFTFGTIEGRPQAEVDGIRDGVPISWPGVSPV
jgi:hypothetical protein